MATTTKDMEKIVALCKRRGFIFPSSEIYGGIGGFWDYGPLGTELKRNIKDAWWNDMVRNPPPGPDGIEFQMVGVDCSIIMNPKVWEASGHVSGFADLLVDCRECKARFRADKVFSLYVLDEPSSQEVDLVASYVVGDPQRAVATSLLRYALGCGLEADSIEEVCSQAAATVTAAAKRNNLVNFKQAEMLVGPKRDTKHGLSPQVRYFTIADKNGKKFWAVALSGIHPRDRGERLLHPICPRCSSSDTLTDPRQFNLMLDCFPGAIRDDQNRAYLRPETAQGIFVNFKNVMDSTRVKIPFGIAQIGKAFRNEINPRNYTFRSREFEQMEIEFFCKPDTSKMWYEFWCDVRIKWYESLGIKSDNLRPRQQDEDELAHYSDACTDIEYLFPFSDEPQELEGVAHRGDFDLKAHGKAAKGKEMAFAVVDDATKERYVPHVIEPSAGADRFTLAAITEAYSFDESRASPEFMCFHPRLAPIKAAVFPLVGKDGMPEIAEPIYREIKKSYPCQYDAKQSIGKRYARMDEAGTPYCFTIDGQTKEDGTITVRDRDDASQIRIPKEGVGKYLEEKLGRLS